MTRSDHLRDCGSEVLEITGMGESRPLLFEPEPAFGWQAYVALIDAQCDQIESNANVHGVAARIGEHTSLRQTLNVQATGNKRSRVQPPAAATGREPRSPPGERYLMQRGSSGRTSFTRYS